MQTLSKKQRRAWEIDGYIHLEGVFDAEEAAFLCDRVDDLRAQPGWEPTNLPRGHYGWVEHGNPDTESFMDRRDLLSYHQAFWDLIDRPGVFDLIVDLMGPYLAFSMSQAIVRASDPGFLGYTHTDGGEGLRRVRVTETSRPLAMKALYLLTDVLEPDSANFTVFPGSHMRPFPELDEPLVTPTTAGAVPLMGKAGDCILFSHSLWHGPGINLSGKA
ncbi:MAG: phytanoyl-CoA dioxygenase family protein, partial [Alphaproteobacteria bacterium]|nr:phytanoyl-CoA dioxygenase family protein [Alphaproteobacteria bacterium]